ncbi:hypothetical protein PMAYCL1PPCAC_04234 [Pristionchus mayeri]|uniref:Uncharacterized protein n=1 Tax=Pristionchus mayeri TaxID=1317129 RepID=A0AAN5C9P1_9BILA|nr:hypothetical protein PMAYCL1PPCAC_04234 [Pristionchus mayeri]
MGSKRRHEEDEEISSKKRRKRDDIDQDVEMAQDSPVKKKRKSKGYELEMNGEVNGDHSFDQNGDEEDEGECVVYLIRKPKTLSVDDLEDNLSLKSKVKNKTQTMKLESGTVYTMRITPSTGNIYHAAAGDLSITNRVAGTVVITENEKKQEEDFIIHNDFLEDPPADIEMPFVIRPVKRNPVLALDGLKQRLQAYGCASTETGERKAKKQKKKKVKREEEDE